MLQALSVLKTPNGLCRRSGESLAFFLHYRATFLLLVAACLVVSTQELFGERIQCNVDAERDVRPEVVNAYCWAAATYSVSSAYFKELGVESPHPGLGASEDQSEYVYRNYYQYVHLVLFLQALLFYLPHLVWKGLEGEHLKGLYSALADTGEDHKAGNAKSPPVDSPKPTDDHSGNSVGNSLNCVAKTNSHQVTKQFEVATAYLVDRWSTHTEYAAKYVLCEALSVANLVAQCYFLNVFLKGEFIGIGHLMHPYFSGRHLDDPVQLFPLVTSCTFKKFGAPGFVDTVDAICVLPTNALNAKIFLLAWAWFAVLLGLSLASLLHLCLCWIIPLYRTLFLRASRLLGLKSRISQAPFLKVLAHGDFGDWFVLGCVRKNMDPLEFSRLMEVLLIKLSAYGTVPKEA